MADFQVILAALLSPDNDTRNQAEVGARNKVFSVAAHETVSHWSPRLELCWFMVGAVYVKLDCCLFEMHYEDKEKGETHRNLCNA